MRLFATRTHCPMTRLLLTLCLLLAAQLGPAHAQPSPQLDLPRVTLTAGMHLIQAQVATTPQQQATVVSRVRLPVQVIFQVARAISENVAGPLQASPTPTPRRAMNRCQKFCARPHIAVMPLHIAIPKPRMARRLRESTSRAMGKPTIA